MREIKFRAWCSVCERFVELNENDFEITTRATNKNELLFAHKENHLLTHMQYTGLKDKNGKEIYEGDVVKHPWLSKEKDKEYGVFKFENTPSFIHWFIEFTGEWDGSYCEVIGNIYENPELITDEK